MKKNNNEVAIANETVEHANKRLMEITEKGFPFTFEEVKMSLRVDSAGIYIYSGATPVCAVYRKGDGDVIHQIKEAIWTTVDATKVAVERRAGLKAEAEAMANDSDQREKARTALLAAGLSTDMIDDVDADAAKAVAKAATEAVKEANSGLFLVMGGCIPLKEAKMHVKAYSTGVVVLAGGKPCLVTRYPRVFNAKGIARMTSFIRAEISALNESRRRYFAEVNEIAAKAEQISREAWRSEKVVVAM